MRPDHIPFEPFLEVLKRELGFTKNNGHGREIGLYTMIGKRCNLKEDSIEKLFKRAFRSGAIDFDLADFIFCRTGGPLLWQDSRLKEIYDTVELVDICSLEGCNNWIKSPEPGSTAVKSTYCSESHRKMAYHQAKKAQSAAC